MYILVLSCVVATNICLVAKLVVTCMKNKKRQNTDRYFKRREKKKLIYISCFKLVWWNMLQNVPLVTLTYFTAKHFVPFSLCEINFAYTGFKSILLYCKNIQNIKQVKDLLFLTCLWPHCLCKLPWYLN